LFNGQRVAVRDGANGPVSWLHGDHLGSASVATNSSGGKIAISEQRFTPYGTPRLNASGLPTDKTFTGQRVENALGGIMDFNARYYDPAIGRFLSADTIVPGPSNPQALNRYAMVLNNPLRYTDPSGHEPCDKYDNAGECEVRYETLPNRRILHTKFGGYIDQEHAGRTSILERVRAAAKQKGGGVVIMDGILAGEYFRVGYMVSEGLSHGETIGVALGILIDYERKWENRQGELGVRQPMSSYSLEDLPSEYLGFVQEVTGLSLEDVVNHGLGGYDSTFSEIEWVIHRLALGAPKNFETRPLDPWSGTHRDWPKPFQLVAPIESTSGMWRVLYVSYGSQHIPSR
jgi:RHS repeat-associated protein